LVQDESGHSQFPFVTLANPSHFKPLGLRTGQSSESTTAFGTRKPCEVIVLLTLQFTTTPEGDRLHIARSHVSLQGRFAKDPFSMPPFLQTKLVMAIVTARRPAADPERRPNDADKWRAWLREFLNEEIRAGPARKKLGIRQMPAAPRSANPIELLKAG